VKHHVLPALSVCAFLSATASAGESLANYGPGTPGTGGITPELWANMTPRPGTASLALTVSRGLAGSVAIPILSNGPGNVSIGTFTFLLNPSLLVFLPVVVLDGQGNGLAPFPLPNDQSLLGVNLFTQALVVDAGAAPIGLSATSGLRIRPSRPGVVIAPRSIGGSADPQLEIDLVTGAFVDFSGGYVDNGQQATFTKDQSHVFIAGALTRTVAIYDARQSPPVYVTSYPTVGQGRPYFISMHPDGQRAYVIHQGSAGQTPAAEVVDANPASATFGQAFPGPSVPLGNIDTMNMVFTPDGRNGFIGVLGLFSMATVMQVDTLLSSPNYNTVLGSLTFPGKYCWGIDIDRDGLWLYAAVGPFTGPMEIAVINALTFQVMDMDPGAAGVQNLGGEISIPRTPTSRQITNIQLDPRGRVLYMAEYSSLGALNVDQGSPGFRTLTRVTAGLASSGATGLAVSDAGELLYVGLASGGAVLEFDTTTMTQLRSFPVGSNITYIGFR
jgi:DNA-binding beta-propeller fold protein YncE